MMNYEMITFEQPLSIPPKVLVYDYNNDIEMIWHMQRKYQKLINENGLLYG